MMTLERSHPPLVHDFSPYAYPQHALLEYHELGAGWESTQITWLDMQQMV